MWYNWAFSQGEKMRIDEALLAKLERLSMLHIDDSKRESTQSQLSEIVGFVENISSIDVERKCFDENLKAPLRDDEPEDSNIAKDVLANAPHTQDNFFVVPKIIE